jgi:hypothetical protein
MWEHRAHHKSEWQHQQTANGQVHLQRHVSNDAGKKVDQRFRALLHQLVVLSPNTATGQLHVGYKRDNA